MTIGLMGPGTVSPGVLFPDSKTLTWHVRSQLRHLGPEDLGRFKRITYDVLCQNTSARADRRRELHGGDIEGMVLGATRERERERLIEMASNLLAMASTLVAMASNLKDRERERERFLPILARDCFRWIATYSKPHMVY